MRRAWGETTERIGAKARARQLEWRRRLGVWWARLVRSSRSTPTQPRPRAAISTDPPHTPKTPLHACGRWPVAHRVVDVSSERSTKPRAGTPPPSLKPRAPTTTRGR